MFAKILTAIVLIAAAATATAEPSQERGFYLVGAGGQSIYDDGGSFGNFGDDEDRSIQLAAGYKILKYLSVEARYVDFGTFDVFLDEINVSTTSIHAVGIVPFRQSGWEFFGQLGLGSVRLDYDSDNFLDGSESTVSAGFGFRWYPTPQVAIGIQTDAYVWDQNNDWETSVGGTQLSVQVIF